MLIFNAGVENKETPRINQPNLAKTPQIRLSVVSPLHYFDGTTVSPKKSGKRKQRKICELFYSSLIILLSQYLGYTLRTILPKNS